MVRSNACFKFRTWGSKEIVGNTSLEAKLCAFYFMGFTQAGAEWIALLNNISATGQDEGPPVDSGGCEERCNICYGFRKHSDI